MHRSVREVQERARGFRPRPVNMSTVAMPPEARECIERIALGIFTDMVNSGATLQETLAAVYLSGSENALAAYRETPNARVQPTAYGSGWNEVLGPGSEAN